MYAILIAIKLKVYIIIFEMDCSLLVVSEIIKIISWSILYNFLNKKSCWACFFPFHLRPFAISALILLEHVTFFSLAGFICSNFFTIILLQFLRSKPMSKPFLCSLNSIMVHLPYVLCAFLFPISFLSLFQYFSYYFPSARPFSASIKTCSNFFKK